MHFSVFDYSLITIFLISLTVFFQKPAPLYLKLFPVYFFAALINGLWVEWLVSHGKYSTGVSNVWGIIEFSFYFFVLHAIIITNKFKRVIVLVSILYTVFAFFNLIFIDHRIGFNNVNFAIGCLITVLACIYYFVELFQKTEIQSLSRSPSFWICSAFLFNTVISFPLDAISTYLEESRKVSSANQFIYRNLNTIGNVTIVLTLLLYAVGFLCRIRVRKPVF
jgi:hypothetical protein